MIAPKATPIVVFGLLALVSSGRAQDAGEIRTWIQQLGSPRFTEREEAQRWLAQSDRAVAFIKLAVVNESVPEIRRRCSRLLDERKGAMRDDVARELDRLMSRGEHARAAALAVTWRYDLREKLANYHTAAATSLAATVEQKTGRTVGLPKLNKARDLIVEDQASTRCVFHTLFAVREIEIGHACTCGFLVGGSLKAKASFTNCIAFVTAPAELRNVDNSVVFVDGDLTLESADESLIVCTGTVKSKEMFDNCTVISGGAINAPIANTPTSLLRPEAKDLGDLVRPWTAQELGIELVARGDRVYAGRVAARSPMSVAGVEIGDIVLSIDGQSIVARDGAVKILRRKSIEFLPFILRVRRGERELELVVLWTLPTASR